VLSGPVRAARLVGAGAGWVLAANTLAVTSDAGRAWTAVTPPGVRAGLIRGVYFRDARRGWVVSASARDLGQLELSVTADGGAAWRTSPIGRPDTVFAYSDSAPAYVDFADSRHGWVEAMAATGSGVAPWGILLHTSNGGATWQRLPSPAGGPVEFVGPATGWLAPSAQPGTAAAGKLYVTRDAGRTWHARTVTGPAGYRPDQVTFTIPAFTAPSAVVLAAFDNGSRSAAWFYHTSDGGASWQPVAAVPARNPAFGEVTPAAAAGPGSWWAVGIDGATITHLTHDGARRANIVPTWRPGAPGGIADVSFTPAGTGWAIATAGRCAAFKSNCNDTIALYATTDGGKHWTRIVSRTTPIQLTASARRRQQQRRPRQRQIGQLGTPRTSSRPAATCRTERRCCARGGRLAVHDP
jgi:photosystem II stability/assembly factor-like uncharacterized protein